MKAAVARGDGPPQYETFADPVAEAGEVIVEMRAAALSNLTRGQGAGRHYSSDASVPFVPGVDGAGRLADGRRVYLITPRKPFGVMAALAPVRRDFCVPIPDAVDDVTAAAVGNPGVSSWAALTERAKFVAGESVLINGATGVSGRLAIRVAKHLGADKVIATGRNPETLKTLGDLGADIVIGLDAPAEELVATFRDAIRAHQVSVVLDYLWGPPAERIIAAIASGGGEGGRRIRFVEIGGMAGRDITLPSAALRSSGLEILGSGLGSVSIPRLVACVGALMQAVVPAGLSVATETVPLSEVAAAWNREMGNRRLVFTI